MSIVKLYNPTQSATNTLKVHKRDSGCCGDETQICKYRVLANVADGVSGVKVNLDGVTTTLSFDTKTSPKDVRVALANALESIGYDPYYKDSYMGISVLASEVDFISELEILALVVNNADVVSEKSCETYRVCKLTMVIPFDTDPGVLNCTSGVGTQIGTTDGFASTESAELQAAVEAALATENVQYNYVDITIVNGVFSVVIHTSTNTPVTLNSTELVNLGCYPDFIF